MAAVLESVGVDTVVDRMLEQVGSEQESLVALLQAIQNELGYLPPAALERLQQKTQMSAADIASVSTFYSHFRHEPVGRHMLSVCHGTACHVKGSPLIEDSVRRHLKMGDGETTDTDREFTLERVACMGCCSLAPVVKIDQLTYGDLNTTTAPKAIDDFKHLGKSVRRAKPGARHPAVEGALGEVRISEDSCCAVAGSHAVRLALEQAVLEARAPAAIKIVGCGGLCHRGPSVEVAIPGQKPVLYVGIHPDDAVEIVRRHFRSSGILGAMRTAIQTGIDRLLTDEAWTPVTRYALDSRDPLIVSYLDGQTRIATEHSGRLSPLDLDEYVSNGGFEALEKVLERGDPDELIRIISDSGLRGRGGAGFPTGVKWARVRGAQGSQKYIICNGDEGDPGAFMDRMLLESFPYRVLEGMALGAFAVGATEGVLYIRHEYPRAVERVTEAIQRCDERGVFERNRFYLKLRVVQGGGAFVCGEETALIASIEGKRGEPRLRPPYPAESGLWGCPTCINNVETYASVPWIVRHGADAFASIGTEKSKGTKVFSLAGNIQRGGLLEVPMGLTIRRVVEEIGGGVPEGHKFKAVQIGGPSGGCVPAELADTPVDYESLAGCGAIMGSGGMVVLDDTTCMVDLTRYFLQFTQYESCGKCTMCRIGTRRLLDILERICTGKGRAGDLEKLDELSQAVCKGSLCGLGQTAPNPILSTLRFFRQEYEAHLKGRCPAGRCKDLIHYRVTETCIGCTLCAQECPVDAIPLRPFEQHEINDSLCTRCDACRRICPEKSIVVE